MKLLKAITEYVAHKRAMGAGFDTDARALDEFSRTLGLDVAMETITEGQINSFLAGKKRPGSFRHRKHTALVGFNRFAIGRGYKTSLPLPNRVPSKPHTFVPYVLTPEELRRLLAAVPNHRAGRLMQPRTLRAILLLLYGAGLRISEVTSLTQGDADLATGVLLIRNSKFHKTRLVPLSPQLNRVMWSYAGWRDHQGHPHSEAAPFFVLRSGAPVNHAGVRSAFVSLREYAGVRHPDGQRPRLHDLRHSFAVHRLLAWYREGADVQRLLPKLSVYLGHKSLVSTQWYLTMTPEVLQEASLRFEKYAFSEVRHG